MTSELDGIEGVMCDLDGVVYRGDQAVPGAAEALARIRSRGTRVVFCTNNSRPTVGQYVEKLASMGIEAAPDDLVTSAVVTAEVLAEQGYDGRRVLVVGGDGVREALAAMGAGLCEASPADAVVVGWDPSFTYEKMKEAAKAVRNGAALVATNTDAAFPAPGGELWPGAGAIVSSIEVAAGASAEVMGKPHAPMMDAIARRLGGSGAIAAIGDRPETDLAGAAARGWKTILVLSGVTPRAEARRVKPRPDAVIGSLAEL
jgi:phosphoglycolate/pyridoxal phosphate phosphatase family enzyme